MKLKENYILNDELKNFKQMIRNKYIDNEIIF